MRIVKRFLILALICLLYCASSVMAFAQETGLSAEEKVQALEEAGYYFISIGDLSDSTDSLTGVGVYTVIDVVEIADDCVKAKIPGNDSSFLKFYMEKDYTNTVSKDDRIAVYGIVDEPQSSSEIVLPSIKQCHVFAMGYDTFKIGNRKTDPVLAEVLSAPREIAHDFVLDDSVIINANGFSIPVPSTWEPLNGSIISDSDYFLIPDTGEAHFSVDGIEGTVTSVDEIEADFDEYFNSAFGTWENKEYENIRHITIPSIDNKEALIFDVEGEDLFAEGINAHRRGAAAFVINRNSGVTVAKLYQDDSCSYDHRNDFEEIISNFRRKGGFEFDYLLDGSDFLNGFEKEEYYDMIVAGKWNELYAMAVEYQQETGNVSEISTAAKIIEYLAPLMDNWADVIVQNDSFENNCRIIYAPVTELSSAVHIVPYYETDRVGEIKCRVGFYEGDWLFFNNIKLDIDSHHSLWKEQGAKEKELLDNGTIFEAQVYQLNQDTIDDIGDLHGHMIRFENTRYEGKHYDYAITDLEADAFEVIKKFSGVENKLREVGQGFY